MPRRLILVALLLLILLPSAVIAQETMPVQIFYALESLSSYLGTPNIQLTNLDSWNFALNRYTDTALGCPLVTGSRVPEGIEGYTFLIGYQGAIYDFRVSVDGTTVFPCNAALLDVGQQFTPVPPLPEVALDPCPADFAGFLTPRLEVGDTARIGAGGVPNRIRELPDLTGRQIGQIQPGQTAEVLQGPSCDADARIVWWLVDANGTVGWTAEGLPPADYFLQPLGEPLLPAERILISADNVDALVPLATLPLEGVQSIAFSPDRSRLALGGLSGLWIYSMTTFEASDDLSDAAAQATNVAFSPDNRYLAFSTFDGQLLILDTDVGEVLELDDPPVDEVNDLDFSPSLEDLLAVGSGAVFAAPDTTPAWYVYDVPANEQILTVPVNSWVRDIMFSDDGALFAWLDTELHVVEVDSGDELYRVLLEQPPLGGLDWLPDTFSDADDDPPLRIAFSDGTMVRLVDLESGDEVIYTAEADFFPGAIQFSPDGSLLAAMSLPPDGAEVPSVVNVFDTETGDLLLSTPMTPSTAMAFSPDGTLLVIASAGEVVFLGVTEDAIAVG